MRQRLELFVQVCRGIQHAHRKGIIHRDLKPSNILVSEIDGAAVPKIIDFGIAKALESDAADVTRDHQRIGTPSYMSPEQASGSGGIDTRSDVFSLGVVLYELLTGERPFNASGGTGAGSAERALPDHTAEPTRPSSRLAALSTDDLRRRRERRLRGDLDWIVLKAIALEPSQRYDSVADFARDIERHLCHEVVAAGPPSARNRLVKLVRRHRLAFAAGSVALAALLVGLALAVAGFSRARRNAEEARRLQRQAEEQTARLAAVSDFLVETLSSIDPGTPGDRVTIVRSVLDDAAARLSQGELTGHAEVGASLHEALGLSYRALTLYPQARAQLELALALRPDDTSTGPTLAARAETLDHLGSVLELLGEGEAADSRYRQAARIRRDLGPDGDSETPGSERLKRLAPWLEGGDSPPGEREALAAIRASGLDPARLADALSGLAVTLEARGRVEDAVALHGEALRLRRTGGPDADGDDSTAYQQLASALQAAGDLDAAIASYRRALEVHEEALPPRHPAIASALEDLGRALLASDRAAEAEEPLRRAQEARESTLPPSHPSIALAREAVARSLIAQGRAAEAAEILDGAIDDAPGDWDAPILAALQVTRGHAALEAGAVDEAEAALLSGHELIQAAAGPAHPLAIEAAAHLQRLYEVTGDAEAAALWRDRRP